MREGDELVVTRVDRLARSIRDLQNIVYDLDKKGVTLSATEQPIDTRTSAGKCFLDMLSVFAEFETNLRKERQMEGIAKAKERGVYKGRKPSVDVDKVKELKEEGIDPVLFGLTDKDFQLIAKNFAHIRNHMKLAYFMELQLIGLKAVLKKKN